MFPEPCVRGPPSKNLVQILRGGSSYTRFLMRQHSKQETPPGGGLSFDHLQSCINMRKCIEYTVVQLLLSPICNLPNLALFRLATQRVLSEDNQNRQDNLYSTGFEARFEVQFSLFLHRRHRYKRVLGSMKSPRCVFSLPAQRTALDLSPLLSNWSIEHKNTSEETHLWHMECHSISVEIFNQHSPLSLSLSLFLSMSRSHTRTKIPSHTHAPARPRTCQRFSFHF